MAAAKAPSTFPGLETLSLRDGLRQLQDLFMGHDPSHPLHDRLQAALLQARIVVTPGGLDRNGSLTFTRDGSWLQVELSPEHRGGRWSSSATAACTGIVKLKLEGSKVRFRLCNLTEDVEAGVTRADALLTEQAAEDAKAEATRSRSQQALDTLMGQIAPKLPPHMKVTGTIDGNYRKDGPETLSLRVSWGGHNDRWHAQVALEARILNDGTPQLRTVTIAEHVAIDFAALFAALS